MAINKQNNYSDVDNNITELQQTVDAQRIGYQAVSLTEYDTSTVPAIAVGSVVEVNGALYEVETSDASISTTDPDTAATVADGTVYIRLTPSGDGSTVSAAFTATAPVWDDEKQGWYESGDTNRYLNFKMTKSSTDYTGKVQFTNHRMNGYLHVRDEKPAGTHGGTFTKDAWRTRDLNTVHYNSIQGASLSSNQITLPAGVYKVSGYAPARGVNLSSSLRKAKIRNITDSTDAIIGTSNDTHFGDDSHSFISIVKGFIEISDTKVFELQHKCTETMSGTGFGYATDLGVVEVYAEVVIEKIS